MHGEEKTMVAHNKIQRWTGLLLALLLCVVTLTPGLAGTITYTYDDAGRLIRVDYGGGVSIIYTYDPAGNLLERQVQGGTPEPTIPTVSPQGQGVESPLPPPQPGADERR